MAKKLFWGQNKANNFDYRKFLENSKENVKKIIERGVSLQKEDGESFEEIEVCVNFLFDNGKISNNKIKGIHKIYTNVKINN